MNTVDNITRQMNILEVDIVRQQQYIFKHGTENDKNPDSAWNQYKEDAEYNIKKWDSLKLIRDSI